MTRLTILHLPAAKGLTNLKKRFPRLAFRLWAKYLVLVVLQLLWGITAYAGSATPPAAPDIYRDAMLAITEGRLNDAETALTALVAEEPRHAGAWLDLAMLYCAAGNASEAEYLFEEIERRFSPPQPIRDVMNHQRQLGCAGWQAKTQTTLRAGRGFESNVNQGARNPYFSIGSGSDLINLVLLPAYRPQSDHFSSLFAEVNRDLSPNGASGVIQFQSRFFDELSSYNTNSLFVGAEYPWRWKGWGMKASASTGLMTLDRKVYLNQNQLQLEVVPQLPLPINWQFSMAESWTYFAYPTLDGFDAQWWETRATLNYRRDDSWFVQGSVSTVLDRQEGERLGGDRTGFLAAIQGRMPLGDKIMGEMSWQLLRWQGNQIYSPGLINIRRVQDTSVLRLAATYPISTNNAFVLEFKDIVNNENISLLEYRDRILQLNWQWQLPK